MSAQRLFPVPWAEGTWREAVVQKIHERTISLPSPDEVDWDRAVEALATEGHLVLRGSWGGRRYCEVRSSVNHGGDMQLRLQRLLGDALGYRAWYSIRESVRGREVRTFRPGSVRVVVRRSGSRGSGLGLKPKCGFYRFFGSAEKMGRGWGETAIG